MPAALPAASSDRRRAAGSRLTAAAHAAGGGRVPPRIEAAVAELLESSWGLTTEQLHAVADLIDFASEMGAAIGAR